MTFEHRRRALVAVKCAQYALEMKMASVSIDGCEVVCDWIRVVAKIVNRTESKRRDVGTANALTKGERTRRRLLDAALKLIERDGYHDLKVTEVAREAGVAAGVYYIYFRDKDALALELLDEIMRSMFAKVFAKPRAADAFDAILEANSRYVALFAAGGGLNRALGQIVDTLSEARARWQATNARIARRIAADIARRAPDSAPHEDARVFAALALQAMLDTVLLQAFAYEFPELAEMRERPERLAQALTVLWHRALYGIDPDPARVPDAADFLTFCLTEVR